MAVNSDNESNGSRSSTSSSDSDSVSNVDLQSEDESDRDQGKSKKKRKSASPTRAPSESNKPRRSKGKGDGKGKDKEDGEKGADKNDEKAEKADKAASRVKTQLLSLNKMLQSLSELTPEAMWRSLIRSVELDRRLTKAASAGADSHKVTASSQATEEQKVEAARLSEEIVKASETATALKEVAKCIRGLSADELARDLRLGSAGSVFYKNLKLCSHRLLPDAPTTMDMIQNVGKKLLDVPCLLIVVSSVYCILHTVYTIYILEPSPIKPSPFVQSVMFHYCPSIWVIVWVIYIQ